MRRIFSDHPLTSSEKNKRDYERNGEKRRKRNKEYQKNHREEIHQMHRNNRHKITQEWFDSKMTEQDSKCAVCFKPFEKTPHIDHDHNCCPPLKSCDRCRRGLLCDDCNLGLGRFKDSIKILQNTISYLQRYGKKEQ